jgi:DNA topoisomerase 2-associated protein PAT1
MSQSYFATIQESDMNVLLGLLGIVLENTTVRTLVLTKVGLCILTMLISRLEVLKTGSAVPQSPQSLSRFTEYFGSLLDATEPALPYIFVSANGSIRDADDFHVWQFLAAMGASANTDQQARLVVGVKDRVMETVRVSRALPVDMQEQRLGVVNLFMKAIGLDVALLE